MSLLLYRPKTGDGAPAVVTPEEGAYLARVAWRPEQHNICQNPDFETDTSGWSASAGINAAGSSIVRVTASPIAGAGSGRITTNAATDSGVNYDFGTATFGRAPYTFIVWMARVSGGHRASIIVGSESASADRARYDFDLTEDPRPYSVSWYPDATRQDVQLAITTGDDVAVVMDIDTVAVHSDRLSQLPWFGWVTEGWTSDGSGQAAAVDALATTTSVSFGGDACFDVTTTSTSGSGIDYYLAGKYTAGRTYRLRVGLRTLSGSTSARLRFGASGDQTDSNVTMTDWSWHTIDWTPSSTTYAAIVSISNASAAANRFLVDHAEVYEATDEVTLGELRARTGARFDGKSTPPGTIDGVILDPDKVYSPRYTASPLYGAVKTGRPIHVRMVNGNHLYPLAYGIITELTPNPAGRVLQFRAEDGLRELKVQIDREFTSDRSYATARNEAMEWTPLGVTNGAPILHRSQRYAQALGIESSTFHDGTDSTVELLSYLAELNQATGSIHFANPKVSAIRPWNYITLDRATLTNSLGAWTFDDDMQRVSDVTLREESLVTRQRVNYQGYQKWPAETIAEATVDLPYLTFTREEYGSTERPEPEDIFRLKRTRGKKKRRRRKLKKVGTRWVDALVPIVVPAGTRHTLTVDFLAPMEDIDVTVTGMSDVTVVPRPSEVLIHLDAGASAGTATAISIDAVPSIPNDEVEVSYTAWNAGAIHEASPIDNEYVPSAGAAEGLAEYQTWRYGESRFRPEYVDQHHIARQVSVRVGAHASVSADRWDVDGVRFYVRGVEHSITAGGHEFETTYSLEELPADASWVTLDGGAVLGLDGSAVLAH